MRTFLLVVGIAVLAFSRVIIRTGFTTAKSKTLPGVLLIILGVIIMWSSLFFGVKTTPNTNEATKSEYIEQKAKDLYPDGKLIQVDQEYYIVADSGTYKVNISENKISSEEYVLVLEPTDNIVAK